MRRLLLAGLVLLAGCAETPAPMAPPPAADRLILTPADWSQLPGWRADGVAAAIPALLKSCRRIEQLPPDHSIGAEGTGGTAADWMAPCGAARHLVDGDDQAARAFFEDWFRVFAAAGQGIFTGYYEPELKGSRHRHGPFTVALRARPKDLITVDLGRLRPDISHDQIAGRLGNGRLDPYPDRAEIEAGAIDDVAPPLVWLDDPVDAHILHIQGSGRIVLDDGTVLRVGVAATNGRRFVGLGKILAEAGKIPPGSSMPVIRAWLKAHPGEAGPLMAGNPRYIFYHALQGGDGPVGSEGVALTAGRSLAVDPAFVPLGMPVWLDTTAPDGTALRRLMLAQDTGAAIKGPVRGDVFWGTGEAAFQAAGVMKSSGRIWLLVPSHRSPRLAEGNR